ncbi:MAG: hypothetical protein RR342_01475 [Bacilli bacterium]
MKDDEIIINNDDILSQALPENVSKFREKLLNYKIPEKDKYGDGFLAQAYIAARNSPTGTYASIRKELKLDSLSFQYYMEKYPDFAAAIQIGLYDSRKAKLSDLEGSLLSLALGLEIEEKRTEEAGSVDEDGNIKDPYRKVTITKKQVPPDANAILTLLKKLDPSYTPKSIIDVNVNKTLNVAEDININVDYRTLSTETIKELLASNKLPHNDEVNKTPEGESVRFLGEQGKKALEIRNEKKKKEEPKPKKTSVEKNVVVTKRVMSEETRRKISEAMKKRYHKEE